MFNRLRRWLFEPQHSRRTYNSGSLPVVLPGEPAPHYGVTHDGDATASDRELTGWNPSLKPIGKRRSDVIRDAFDPGRPVDGRFGLSGRANELDKLVNSVLFEHKHGIIFGARGLGKTSLARAFGDVADEQGTTVLYNSVGGDLSFVDLFRPFLRELAHSSTRLAGMPSIQQLQREDFDASILASTLAEAVTRQTIFLVDEFDRIDRPEIKAEVAALMKLLSDMRSNVRLLIVGIAMNLEDLIEGHPSLRRHMTSVSIAGLHPNDQEALLQSCCDRAGLSVGQEAAEMIRVAAIGSPYHLRLFGLHAALIADSHNEKTITSAMVSSALSVALGEWSETNSLGFRTIDTYIDSGASSFKHCVIACWIAATHGYFSLEIIHNTLIAERICSPADVGDSFSGFLKEVGPLIRKSQAGNSYMFQDTLLPQFFILMLQGIRPPEDQRAHGDDPTLSNLLAGTRIIGGAAG